MQSDHDIPSLARVRPGSVTSTEASANRRATMPVLLHAPHGTPLNLPTINQLIAVVRSITSEPVLRGAVDRLEREIRPLLGLDDALCVWVDWPRRVVWSLAGRASAAVHELVLAVAGTGRRTVIGNAVLQPIGPPPARAVLAIRRAPAHPFAEGELALVSTLASSVAPTLDRLIAAAR